MKIRFLLLILLFVLCMITVRAAKSEFYTCELDLVNDNGDGYSQPWRPSFLTQECAAVYAKRTTDPKGYELYENEANEFRKFIAALEMYEVKKSGLELCANGKYALYLKDRKEFYKQSNLCDCYKKNNKESFLSCLAQKRKELVNVINNN